jgi:hypothetical protein
VNGHERRFDDVEGFLAAPDVDGYLIAFFHRRVQECQRNTFLQRRRERSGGNFTERRPGLIQDRHVRPRNTPSGGPQTAQDPGRSALLLGAQGRVAPEVLLLPADGPSGPRLDGRDAGRDVLAVQRVPHLGPQRVPRAQSGRDDAVLLAGRQQRVEHGHRGGVRYDEFEAALARVAGAAHDHRRTAEVGRGGRPIADTTSSLFAPCTARIA